MMANQPDIMLNQKRGGDRRSDPRNIRKKERKKLEKCHEMKEELEKMWGLKSTVVSVVMRAPTVWQDVSSRFPVQRRRTLSRRVQTWEQIRYCTKLSQMSGKGLELEESPPPPEGEGFYLLLLIYLYILILYPSITFNWFKILLPASSPEHLLSVKLHLSCSTCTGFQSNTAFFI